MIRLHYRIADTIDECLEKLGAGGRPAKVKASRRGKFEANDKISKALVHLESPSESENLPAIITAALNERHSESDWTSMSDSLNF
jgi:hypothetical protein